MIVQSMIVYIHFKSICKFLFQVIYFKLKLFEIHFLLS